MIQNGGLKLQFVSYIFLTPLKGMSVANRNLTGLQNPVESLRKDRYDVL